MTRLSWATAATLLNMNAIAELAEVRLRRSHGRWAAGARGVVVNHRPGSPVATVDFSELVSVEEREVLDFFDLVTEVEVADLEVVEAAASSRAAGSS
jgi:hypothetical protein